MTTGINNALNLAFKVLPHTIVLGGVTLLFAGIQFLDAEKTNDNREKYKQVTAQIDAGKSFIFSSVETCLSQKNTDSTPKVSARTCNTSQTAAMKWLQTQDTSVSYKSLSECETRHGTCSVDSKTFVFGIRPDNGTMSLLPFSRTGQSIVMPSETTSDTYYPTVRGWQASANDLTKAVPLYSTPVTDVVVRFDGKKINFPNLNN